MSRVITVILFFMAIQIGAAQQNKEEQAIKKVVETFFEGLHNGDSTLIAGVLHEEIKIQTTGTTRDGVKFLRSQKREQVLTGIANKKPENKYFEKLLSYNIKIDGNLASVWTPYEFYLNDNFSHCGANSFQMFNNNGKWEIIYLVDMRRREGCKPSEDKK